MVKNVNTLSRASFLDFFSVLRKNFGNIFLYTFLLWLCLSIYESLLFMIGQASFFASLNEELAVILLYVLELPFLYLFFALSIYYLKKMFYPELTTKQCFSIGLKLFVIDLIFLIIITIFGRLFLIYSGALWAILFAIITLVFLFLIFSSSKTVMKGNIQQNFFNTFKQFSNPKAIGYYLLTLVFMAVIFGIQEIFIYLTVLPEPITFVTLPFGLVIAYYMAYYSVKN